jgi:hypothetical protein
LPLDPSKVPGPPPPVQDVSATLVQDVSESLIQDVSATLVSAVLPQPQEPQAQDVSATLVPVAEEDVCPIDLSGTDVLIQKIDKILDEMPENSVENAIAKLWVPQTYKPLAVPGSPMSRATTRG